MGFWRGNRGRVGGETSAFTGPAATETTGVAGVVFRVGTRSLGRGRGGCAGPSHRRLVSRGMRARIGKWRGGVSSVSHCAVDGTSSRSGVGCAIRRQGAFLTVHGVSPAIGGAREGVGGGACRVFTLHGVSPGGCVWAAGEGWGTWQEHKGAEGRCGKGDHGAWGPRLSAAGWVRVGGGVVGSSRRRRGEDDGARKGQRREAGAGAEVL